MLLSEKTIPFPLDSARGDVPRCIAQRIYGEKTISLIEVGPLTAPGYCELTVGPGLDSSTCIGLTIDEGRLLLLLTVHQLQRGKSCDAALEIATILMMYR